MAKKKQTLATLSQEELQGIVAEKREALRSLRFSVAGSKNRNVKEAKGLRHDIARALTQHTALNNSSGSLKTGK